MSDCGRRSNEHYNGFVAADRCDLLCLDLPRAERLRCERLTPDAARKSAARAGALASPTRLVIASALLSGGELCVCDLAWICERSISLISHHVRALRAAGLVSVRRDGRMAMYALTGEGERLLASVLPSTAEAAR